MINKINIGYKKPFLIVLLVLAARALPAQEWQDMGRMPIAVYGCQATVHENRIYVFGGYSDSLGRQLDMVQIYDPASGAWQVSSVLQQGRSHFALALLGDKVLICGGSGASLEATRQLEAWDYYSSSLILQQNPLFNRTFSRAGSYGTVLYLFGGYPGEPGPSLPYILGYDTALEQIVYSDTTSYPGDIPYDHLSARVNDHVFIFGGIYNTVSNRVYRFSLPEHLLQRLQPNMPEPRAGGAAVYSSDMQAIYLLGGYNDGVPALARTTICRLVGGQIAAYDQGPGLNAGRKQFAAVYTADDYIYILGGKNQWGLSIPDVQRLNVRGTTSVQENAGPVDRFDLDKNYPNPFNSSTRIRFHLEQSGLIQLDIFTPLGRHVRDLGRGWYPSGTHGLQWDGCNQDGTVAASGVYLLRLSAEGRQQTQKMMLIR